MVGLLECMSSGCVAQQDDHAKYVARLSNRGPEEDTSYTLLELEKVLDTKSEIFYERSNSNMCLC